MTARDWIPEPPMQENPQLRLFLDRATAVVAQCGGLNARSRLLLGKLAEELGISREEAEPVIHTLLVATEDFAPTTSNGRQQDRAGIRPPPPLPKNAAVAESGPPQPPPVVMIDEEAILQNFLDQATYVLAQHGGLNAKTRVILTQLSQSMGITADEMDAAIAKLGDAARGIEVMNPPRAVTPPPPPLETGDLSPPQFATAPIDPGEAPTAPPRSELTMEPKSPPRSQPAPQEVYRSYLHRAVDDLRRPRINPRREQRLIEQGVNKLGLSPVFARQLLCDVARERQVTIESQPPQAPSPTPHDEHTAAFITRARAIIAEERGMTAPGQVKIAAAAAELGLSDEERQRALAQMQENGLARSQEEIRRHERLDAYRQWLRQAIPALPRKIMTPDVVAELVATGSDAHGVAADEAEAVVRETAAAQGLRFVSQQRAVEHLARRVSEKMGGAAVLYPTDRQRILTEGAQWGLSPQDVEAIVSDQVEINRRAHAAKRKRAGIAVAAIGAGAFALASLVLASTLLNGTRPVDNAVSNAGDPSDERGDKASPTAATPNDWWDVELSVAMTRAEVELPYARPGLRQVSSYTPAVRRDGYRQILSGLPRAVESRTAMAVLEEIISGAYALDPAEESASAIREQLMAPLPDPKTAAPADVDDMEQAYAAVNLAVAAATREGVSDSRAEALRRRLGQALAFTPDPSWEENQLQRESGAALTRFYYRIATASAGSDPAAVQPMHQFVSAQAERHLDPAAVARLDADFLEAIFAEDETVWRHFYDPILRVITSEDPNVVLRAVELLENVRHEDLRYYLANGLLRRIGATPHGQSPDEVAAAVRLEFGAGDNPARTAESGWRRFTREAEEELGQVAESGDEPLQLLEQAANLARLAAMGAALSKGAMGQGHFQQILEIESLSLQPRTSDGSNTDSTAEISTPRTRAISRQIETLARTTNAVQRFQLLKHIAENVSQIPEIEPQEGEVIAKALLAPKGDEERQAIAGLIPRLGRWKMVRLAAADQIVDTPVRQDLVEEVVARLLGEEPNAASGGDDWRERARLRLMRSVLTGGVATFGVHPFDAAREAMLTTYDIQAKIQGVAPASYSGAASPTAILSPMIEKLASQLAAKARTEEDRIALARVPHELTAAEYLAENDLRRLALLERIWLRLLALELAQVRGDRAADAQAIVEQLAESDREAKDVFQQLRDGQAAIVRLWLTRGT